MQTVPKPDHSNWPQWDEFFVVCATKAPPYLGGHDALPSPIRHFGGTCPLCPPRDLRHCVPLPSLVIYFPNFMIVAFFEYGGLYTTDRHASKAVLVTVSVYSTPY